MLVRILLLRVMMRELLSVVSGIVAVVESVIGESVVGECCW